MDTRELTIDVESLDHVDSEYNDLDGDRPPGDKGCNNCSPRSKPREDQRLHVNARERHRMHDLNSSLDALRQVMPYAQGPSVKKPSKMNTLLLARDYILLLRRSTEELKRVLAEGCISATSHPHMTSSDLYAVNVAKHSGRLTSFPDKPPTQRRESTERIFSPDTKTNSVASPIAIHSRVTPILHRVHRHVNVTDSLHLRIRSLLTPAPLRPVPVVTTGVGFPQMSSNIPCPCSQCLT